MNVKYRRLPKQLGDFGESLVTFLFGNIKGHRVAIVDHEAADIIATDRLDSKLRYAISVKSRRFKKDDASIAFVSVILILISSLGLFVIGKKQKTNK